MTRPQVCLVSDPAQWGFLDARHPATDHDPEMVDVTWIGLLRPDRRVAAAAVRPVHDLDRLPPWPIRAPDEDEPAFEARREIARTARETAIVAMTGETLDQAKARWAGRNRKILAGLVADGVFAGVDDEGTPLPHARRISIAALGPGATTADLMVALGIFPSITQAKRNGHGARLVLGLQVLTKKRIAVEIVP